MTSGQFSILTKYEISLCIKYKDLLFERTDQQIQT